jgi:hypothetical protein
MPSLCSESFHPYRHISWQSLIFRSMFFHLQYIHLFRPFLRYAPSASPLPAHVSPRRICTANAGAISKLMRLYKKLYNLRQICNIAVYMLHSATTIHLLNLPEKTAKRDVIHGVKHLEEIAEDWICGRRSLSIISVLSRKWNVELPEAASQVLQRTDERWGTYNTSEVPSPRPQVHATPSPPAYMPASPTTQNDQYPAGPAAQAPTGDALAGPLAPTLTGKEMMNNITPAQPGFQNARNMQAINEVAMIGRPVMLDFNSRSTNSSWRRPPVTQPGATYPSTYVPMVNRGGPGKAPRSTTPLMAARGVPLATGYAVDGQDWYLKDGVNWQSGFDGWNLGSGGNTSGANTAGNNSPPSPSVFLFAANNIEATDTAATRQSPTTTNFDFDSLDSLSSSINGWESLEGLD